MKMEIVFKEEPDGERKIELWEGHKRICVCEKVSDQRRLELMARRDTAAQVLCVAAVGAQTLATVLGGAS